MQVFLFLKKEHQGKRVITKLKLFEKGKIRDKGNFLYKKIFYRSTNKITYTAEKAN